jgi:dTDP-4-dehydrorhamnose 3,5-epimerase
MKIIETPFAGLYEIELVRLGDERGWLMRTFDAAVFAKSLPDFSGTWVQMNHTFNETQYTWRGFHFQLPPFAETKLIRCVSGRVLDFVLDLREESSTYLKIYQTELSSSNAKTLLVPKGVAHGYLTLEKNAEMIYMHDQFYSPEFERGVRYNDKKINFVLPYSPALISERDLNHIDL